MNKYSALFLLALSSLTSLFSESLQLANNSPYKLDAVIIDANGKVLGMTTVPPNNEMSWNYDSSKEFLYANSPYVPFTVIWYCHEGAKEYGIWTLATTGSRVTSQGSRGPKICKLKNADKLRKEAEQMQSINNFTYD